MHTMEAIASAGAVSVQVKQTNAAPSPVQAAARTIIQSFSTSDNGQTKAIVLLAVSSLTVEEYEQAEKTACTMADEIDKAAGFKPPEGAKGANKYGPRRCTMNVQSSMRRQVFGAAKHLPDQFLPFGANGVLFTDALPVFSQAVKQARELLDKAGITWKGITKEAEAGNAAAKKATRTMRGVREEVEKSNPMQPGENYAAWQQRIAKLIEEATMKAEDAEVEKLVSAQAAKLIEKHGAQVAMLIADRIMMLVNPKDDAPF